MSGLNSAWICSPTSSISAERSSLPASSRDTVLTVSSSAARCCASAKRRAFSIATAAASDRPTRNSSSVSRNGRPALRQTAIAPFTVLPARSGATISRSSLSWGVPAICTPRGSWSASLTNSARPLAMMLPMMPTPDWIDMSFNCAAMVPSATMARKVCVPASAEPSGRKIALLSASSSSLAWRAMRSITVGRSSVDEMSRPTSASAALSRVRRWISSNRRAFSRATPMLAATVVSRRSSDSPKACSRSKLETLR